jgi:hypothetical protein
MALHGKESGEVSYETDRLKFIGLGKNIIETSGLEGVGGGFKCTFRYGRFRSRIRCFHSLPDQTCPGESATLDMVTGMSVYPRGALAWLKITTDRRLADRVFNLAWTHSRLSLRQINATQADAQLFGRLAVCIYANDSLRADPIDHCQKFGDNSVCGGMPFPVICPLFSCRSAIMPTLNWPVIFSRPMPTGV